MEAQTVKTADLLAGDKKRATQYLEELAENLRAHARRHLGELIGSLFESNERPATIEQRAKDLLAEEIPPFFAAKLAWFSNEVNCRVEQATAPYQERLDDLIGTLRSTAAELFEISYRAPSGSGAFETRHKPYWITQKWSTSISPVPEGFSDRFSPSEMRKRRTRKRLCEEVESLVIHNVENIRWAMLRNLDDAFRRVSAAFDERLKETAEATRHAMQAAHLKQKQNENTSDNELTRLRQKGRLFAELEDALSHYAAS